MTQVNPDPNEKQIQITSLPNKKIIKIAEIFQLFSPYPM